MSPIHPVVTRGTVEIHFSHNSSTILVDFFVDTAGAPVSEIPTLTLTDTAPTLVTSDTSVYTMGNPPLCCRLQALHEFNI